MANIVLSNRSTSDSRMSPQSLIISINDSTKPKRPHYAKCLISASILLFLTACGDGQPAIETIDTPPVVDEASDDGVVSFAAVNSRAGAEGCLSGGCHAGNGRDWFRQRAGIIIRATALTQNMIRGGMQVSNLPSQSLRDLVAEWVSGDYQ